MFLLAQDGAGAVSLQFLPFGVLQIELRCTGQLQQLLDLREAAFAVVLQRID
jgi:hypothetical protein